MSQVDGISPPKSSKSRTKKTVKIKKYISEKAPIKKKKINYNIKDEHKHKLVWLISIGIVIIIFIGWLSLFQGTELSTTNDNSFLSRISNNFDQLWSQLKEDILKINNDDENINNTNEAEQQLKELEEKVFPEFIESN